MTILAASIHELLGEEPADELQQPRVVRGLTVIEVVHAPRTPTRVVHIWQATFNILALSFKYFLEVQTVFLVGGFHQIQINFLDLVCRHVEVVLILTVKSNGK